MLNIIQAGAGPLGLGVSKFILQRRQKGLNLVGVVDLNPELEGKDIGELSGEEECGVTVSVSLDEAIDKSRQKPSVAVVTTVSSAKKIIPTIEELAERKLDIVTTCEELSYPWQQHPDEAEKIDKICRNNGVTCLATGVNPGFLMDYFPSVITSICQRVDHIEVQRFQDASVRRVPFQKKIGAGLTHEEFEEAKKRGVLRHVGLPESVDMIAAAMRVELDDNSETLDKVLAKERVNSGYKLINEGMPSGVEQVATGSVESEERIRLVFRAAIGEGESYDKVVVRGEPNLESVFHGGVNGDVATSAITVNALGSVYRTESGLKTMLDIPVPSYFE